MQTTNLMPMQRDEEEDEIEDEEEPKMDQQHG
jgi:hypothetical protein